MKRTTTLPSKGRGPSTSAGRLPNLALAMYYELLELIPYARKGAEVTDARLLSNWERDNKPRIRSCG